MGSARQKYSAKGMVRKEALYGRVRNPKTAEALAKKANFGLSKNTWETYQTTLNHLITCSEETGTDMSFPFDENKTLEFVGWMEARGLKSGTMSTYLSGIRACHISVGYNEPCLRFPMIRMILKGQDNWDRVRAKLDGKVGRLPVTITMMKFLKNKIIEVNWPLSEKRLFWAIATIAWSGAFRIHELCSKNKTQFDPQTTLLWGNIKTGNLRLKEKCWDTISVFVKSPKVDRVGAGDDIEVFQLDNFMCPTAALARNREINKLGEEPDMPVFRFPTGQCFTGDEMNRRLRLLTATMSDVVPGGEIRSHSFRSGVISEMARAGYSEQAGAEYLQIYSGPKYLFHI